MVEWSRALDVRLSEWCCSVSMVWVQIPSREEHKFDSSKNLILTLFGLIFRRIYIFIHVNIFVLTRKSIFSVYKIIEGIYKDLDAPTSSSNYIFLQIKITEII